MTKEKTMKFIRTYYMISAAALRSVARALDGIPIATGFALGALFCVWMICALGIVFLAL